MIAPGGYPPYSGARIQGSVYLKQERGQTLKFNFKYSEGVPAVGGLKFSMAQKKLQKVPVGGTASWGKC